MKWKGFAKGLLFCAGMVGGVAAGHLFYLGRYMPGGAMFALTGLFLFYAMADLSYAVRGKSDAAGDFPGGDPNLREALARLALLAAENAVDGAKRIGRTLPCSPTELAKLEEDLMPLLNELHVERKDKERISQEFEKLRTRSRENEGRRALTGNRF